MTDEMAGVDYPKEIVKVWSLNPDEVTIRFIHDSNTDGARTEISDARRRHGIVAEIKAPGVKDYDIIVYHEGAHIYLATLNYPALIIDGVSYVDHYDFLNEYYAITLEMSRIFPERQARAGAVKRDFTDMLNKKWISYGMRAYRGAIYVRMLEEMGVPTENMEDMLFKWIFGWKGPDALSDFKPFYFEALSILREAPRIQRRKFTVAEVEKITRLLGRICHVLLRGECKLIARPVSEWPVR
jgi:hypothetical protein